MHILFNGANKNLDLQEASLALLLKDHNIDPTTPGIAIAVNYKIIPREQWSTHLLHDKDQIEVVHAVQGG